MARKRANNQLRRRAKRDVRSAYQPVLRDLQGQKREARDLYEEGVTEAGDIYERTNNMLGDLMPNWKEATGNISEDYIGDLSQLSGILGLSAPDSGEDVAAQQLLGGIGGATLGNMADSQQRNLAYMQSSKRQALYDRNTTEKNYLEDFQDIVREIGNTRFDLRQDMATQVMQRFDELRQQRFEKRMANKEYELRKTIADRGEKHLNKAEKGNRRAQNYAVEQLEDADTKNDLRKLINRISGNLDETKSSLADLREDHEIIQRDGKWGYMMIAGGEPRFIELPEYGKLKKKKRKQKQRIAGAKRKKRRL